MVAHRADRDEQIELWRRAFAGDRAAYDLLARSVAAWTAKKAAEYAAKFGVRHDDLVSAGLARLPYAVRAFKEELGWSFLNYYCSVAARGMIEEAKRTARGFGREAVSAEAAEQEAAPAADPRADAVGRARAEVGHLGMTLLERYEGVYGPRRSAESLAVEYGMTVDHVRRKVAAAKFVLRRYAEGV